MKFIMIVILHVCTTCLHTRIHVIERVQRLIYHLLVLLLNAEQYPARLQFLCPSARLFLSPSLVLTSCLILTLLHWNPVAMLAEKLIWLADRPVWESLACKIIWVTFLTGWDLWLLLNAFVSPAVKLNDRLTGSVSSLLKWTNTQLSNWMTTRLLLRWKFTSLVDWPK